MLNKPDILEKALAICLMTPLENAIPVAEWLKEAAKFWREQERVTHETEPE